ncbi:MAG: hypothetical protein QG652_1025, partial [Pseudomonadota bacterium]|nr:hypothetical protein [Pseudomonadota bacterium]
MLPITCGPLGELTDPVSADG